MQKMYFVLTELIQYSNYPTLVRVKDYANKKGVDNPNTRAIAKDLEDNQGFIRVESATNIILIDPVLKFPKN